MAFDEVGSRQYSLQILDRTAVLLEEIAGAEQPLGVSALARRTGIPKTTVDRMVETLKAHELIAANGSGLVIGPRMYRLASVVQHRTASNLGQLLLPSLIELYEETGDLVVLTVLDGAWAVLVQRLVGPRHRRFAPRHSRFPAHRSASGLALLAPRVDTAVWPETLGELRRSSPHTRVDAAALGAELHQVRRQGFALHQRQDGTAELAMPVVSNSGPVAAIARIRPQDAPFDRTTIDVQHEIAVAASATLRRHPFRHHQRL